MSEKIPRITADKIMMGLGKIGFVCVRQSGSYMILKNSEGKRVTVPYHSKKDPPSESPKEHTQRCRFDRREIQKNDIEGNNPRQAKRFATIVARPFGSLNRRVSGSANFVGRRGHSL